MAAATATATVLFNEKLGERQFYICDITIVGDYATGGVALDLSADETITSATFAAPGYVLDWDRANQKVVIYRQKDPAAAGGADIPLPQVTNAATLSSFVAHGHLIGQ